MHKITEICRALDGKLVGDETLTVTRAAEPAMAGPDDIAIALTSDFITDLPNTKAKVALLPSGVDWENYGLTAAILVPRGRLAMAQLSSVLKPQAGENNIVHASAVIDPSVEIASGVSIGAFCVIGAGAHIASNTILGAHVSIGENVSIGADCAIGDGTRIQTGVQIGCRVTTQPNVVIGSDGFSFVTKEPAHVEIARKTMGNAAPPVLIDPSWHKIHSLGSVVIGDDVEIGAGSTIDAGTLRATRIGRGSKLDNLVQIGHNVIVGEHCLICAQAGVAGSSVIGDRTVIGGKAGVADNIKIGADVVLGGGSVVLSNVPDGRVMLGYPAVKLSKHIESYKALRRLPRLMRRLAGIKKQVSNPDKND